ncbi:MAG: DNA polymerase, partial [Dysosmobacter sp.]
PLCRVLAEMELAGCRVDAGALASFGELLAKRSRELETAIYGMAGGTFNINSPKQLGEVLFDRLGLPHGKKTKTGWSTNADVLEKLRPEAPIVDAVLEYRQYAKLKSTYADGLLKALSPDGRVRTSFQMTVTATGRLSSTEPNLQNIPTRTDLGSEIRRMFVPAGGCVLVDADYSQIELRLLAHVSGDENMRESFLAGGDFHAQTAARVFHVDRENVTHEMRRRAKAVNFGIVYGISAFSLSQDIGTSVAEAKDYMDAYFAAFPGVRRYMDTVVEQAREQGYVETIFHRRRDLPELVSSNRNMRAFGERVALNMPIQGAAADVMKLAMIAVWKRLRAERPHARLVLQVHDELIVECPEDEAEAVARILTEEMENVVRLSVPLTADAHWGKNWLEAKG